MNSSEPRITEPTGAVPAAPEGHLSFAEASEVRDLAAVEIRRRLVQSAEGLPHDLVRIVHQVAEDLFDPDLDVTSCRERAGVRDTGISGKVTYYLGDSLWNLFEKRRIETAVRLVRDRRFTAEHLSEAMAGQVGAKEALDRAAQDWDEINERLGKEEQLKYYQESIGYKP